MYQEQSLLVVAQLALFRLGRGEVLLHPASDYAANSVNVPGCTEGASEDVPVGLHCRERGSLCCCLHAHVASMNVASLSRLQITVLHGIR